MAHLQRKCFVYYNIKNNLIDFVAERNKNKYSLFTPGTKIKIISEVLSRLQTAVLSRFTLAFKKEILVREKVIRKKEQNLYFRSQK